MVDAIVGGVIMVVATTSLFLAIEVAEKKLLGDYAAFWPLTKILDIGGSTVSPSFGGKEVPPIPCHVHCGNYDPNCSACTGQGKLEAYFFPPLDVPP